MSVRRLEIVEMIDWYDGIVMALVRASWKEGTFLATLLAWDVKARERILALIPLNEVQLSEIHSRLGGDWDELKDLLKQISQGIDSDVSVIRFGESSEEITGELMMSGRDVRGDAVSDIEEACTPERMRWFESVSAAPGT